MSHKIRSTGRPKVPWPARWLALAAAGVLTSGLALTQTGCHPDARAHYGRPGPPPLHFGGPPHGGLKPKDKARLGFGRHAGHPRGGPPGHMRRR